jgi:hypothetical protein
MAEAELQDYLEKNGVEVLLKDLVVQLCVAKPDNVLEFMKEYITKKQQEQNGGEEADDAKERFGLFLF